jgi:hypothetical protein
MKVQENISRWVQFLAVCFVLLSTGAAFSGTDQRKKVRNRSKASAARTPDATRQQEEDVGRGMDNENFKPEKKINAAGVIANRRRGRPPQGVFYQATARFPDGPQPRGKTYATVGVTITRGRPMTDAELADGSLAKVNGCVQRREGQCIKRQDMVLERIANPSVVSDGEQVQMVIEYLAYLDASGTTQSDRVGYLYVMNREQYPNKSYGPPSLIYPTSRTFRGDSRVLPGKVATLPAPNRFWTISRSTSGTIQDYETYTIIISPRPLKDLRGRDIQRGNVAIKPEELEVLLPRWLGHRGGAAERAELENREGRLVTQQEQEAGGNPNNDERSTGEEGSDLAQDDPPPQTVFSKVVRPGGKLLITIRLPYKGSAEPPATGQ